MVVQLAQRFRGGIVSPILALFIRGQGLTLSQIGLLGTAGMLGWLIFEPIAGVVADRIRKKYMVIFAYIGSTVIYLAYPFAQGFWNFAFLAFGMSSVMSAYAVSVKALTVELLPKSDRGKAYGRFVSAISLGSIVSPIIGGYVSEAFGEKLPFYISAFVGLIGLAAVILMNYDDRGSVEQRVESKKAVESYSHFHDSLLGIFLVRALFIFNQVFRQHTLPIFLNENPRYLMSEGQIGFYFGIVRLSSALSQAYLGDFNDRVGSRRVIASSLLMSGLSYGAILGFSGVPVLLAIGTLQGVFFAASDVSMMVYLMDVMPLGRTGMVMGLYSEAENVGGMLAAPSLGWIYDSSGPGYSMLSVAGVLVLDSLLSVVLINENKETDQGITNAT
jgi:DHA1 family multidrug resistance protein-like MFS transporter